MQLLSEFRLRTLNTPFGFYDRTLIDMHLQSLYQHKFGRKIGLRMPESNGSFYPFLFLFPVTLVKTTGS